MWYYLFDKIDEAKDLKNRSLFFYVTYMLLLFLWLFKLFCIDTSMQYKAQHKKSCLLFLANSVSLSWAEGGGGESFPSLNLATCLINLINGELTSASK